MDQNRLKWTKVDRNRDDGPKWTEIERMDQI